MLSPASKSSVTSAGWQWYAFDVISQVCMGNDHRILGLDLVDASMENGHRLSELYIIGRDNDNTAGYIQC